MPRSDAVNDEMHSLVALVPTCLTRLDSHDARFDGLEALTDERFDSLKGMVKQAVDSVSEHMSTALASHSALHEAYETAHGDAHLRDKEAVARAEALAIERLAIALSGHTQLHAAADAAHAERHGADQEALRRAETTMSETARLHATSHEREHQLAKEALNKADVAHAREHQLDHEALEKADAASLVKFEALNQARARASDERASFATKEALDDKNTAMADRMVAVERYASAASDRIAIVNTAVARIGVLETDMVTYRERMVQVTANGARLDAVEKLVLANQNRDKGVALSWGVLLAAIAATATVVALLARLT